MELDKMVNCAKCTRPGCNSPVWQEGPANCPHKVMPEVITKATEKCFSPEFRSFAVKASKQEGSGYLRLPHAPNGPSPVKSRVEEVMKFAQRMGYTRLGVAYCGGIQFEASLLVPILENRGFEVASVQCKCGSVPKEDLGIEDWEKVSPGHFEAMPRAQCLPRRIGCTVTLPSWPCTSRSLIIGGCWPRRPCPTRPRRRAGPDREAGASPCVIPQNASDGGTGLPYALLVRLTISLAD
jgi:hypothetical protein